MQVLANCGHMVHEDKPDAVCIKWLYHVKLREEKLSLKNTSIENESGVLFLIYRSYFSKTRCSLEPILKLQAGKRGLRQKKCASK